MKLKPLRKASFKEFKTLIDPYNPPQLTEEHLDKLASSKDGKDKVAYLLDLYSKKLVPKPKTIIEKIKSTEFSLKWAFISGILVGGVIIGVLEIKRRRKNVS